MTTTFGYTGDKLTSFGGTTIAYNSMGCPTTYEGKTATWSKGRLSRLFKGTLATGTSNYTYSYNALGQRVSKSYSYLEGTSGNNPVQAGQVTAYNKNFYYDHAGRLIAESGSKTYYGTGAENESIVYLYDENAIIGMEHTVGTATTRYYFQRNLQGDVVAIYDTYGALKAKYLYDAWGNCTISSETTDYAVANANPIRYRGYYYDDDTGLYYCNARYYSPKWRRFISPDSTSYPDPESVNGLNLYCYCNNDPVNFIDPSGHSSTKSHLFGYEWRTSAGWEDSPMMLAGPLGIIGISSYTTHTEGRSGMLYGFAGITSDVTSFLDSTFYFGVGVDFFGILGAEVQLETIGVGVSVSFGNFSISLNANLFAATSITFAWDTDLGEGFTRTDGFSAGLNTIGLLAVAAYVYLWYTTGFAAPSTVPAPVPQPII